MTVGSKLLWRALAAGLAAGAILCVTFGLAVWELAGSSARRRPSGVAAGLNPPPLTFWERADLLLFRGRAARAGAGSVAGAPAAGAAPPAEFAQYLQGAFAYRRGDLAAAAGQWRRLLALPERERHYRSTWAAFMLGRAALRRSPADLDAAAGWFQRTRELAARGFADSLGLAVTSLGWEARANAALRRYDRAEALYAQQADAGDPSGIDSLRILWRERLLHEVLGR